jgi:hypothetical protein
MVSPKLAERVSGVVLHLKGVQVVTVAGRPSVRKNPFGTFNCSMNRSGFFSTSMIDPEVPMCAGPGASAWLPQPGGLCRRPQCPYDLPIPRRAPAASEDHCMKVICAAAVIAMLAGQAFAQGKTPGPPPPAPKSQQEIEAERAAEKAYKNSLRNIPDQPPADPWGNARSMDAPKAAATTPAAKIPAAKKSPAKTGSTAN